MEREVSALRRELDASRAALRLQTARCRQLVAAYSARLRAGDALRDHQLALVLRALVALEARLRREQRAIRAQLGQRDAIIHQQQVEISRLRAAQQTSTPVVAGHAPASRTSSASSAPPATPSQLIVVNHTCGQDSSCEAEQQDAVNRRSQGQRGRAHIGPSLETVVVDSMSHLRHQEAALRVLELVGPPAAPTATTMPLLNGETACIVEPPADFIEDHDALTPPPDVVAGYTEMNRECLELASMAASLRSGVVGDREKGVCFQDNPVLECVNLILLRDQDDFQEERRGQRHRGQQPRGKGGKGRRSTEESPTGPPAWYDSKGGGPGAPRRAPPPALPPKPPRLVAQRPPPRPSSKSASPTPASPTPTSPTSTSPTSISPTSTSPTSASPTSASPTSASPTSASPIPASPIPASPIPASPIPASPLQAEREDASETLRRNFEEFNMDECDVDIEGLSQHCDATRDVTTGEADERPRPEGDGAESGRQNGLDPAAPAEVPQPVVPDFGLVLGPTLSLAQQLAQLAPANYDTFLEATGLSNKSILTPSRMLSNHRSVLKPKDVKHRSRVKAGERCAVPGATVKYWTEPFL